MDALFDWASTTNIFYCRTIFTVQARNCVPVRARTGQFAPVAPLRSALHSNRTFTTRGLYFIDRCGRSASAVNSRGSLRYAPLCAHTEHS